MGKIGAVSHHHSTSLRTKRRFELSAVGDGTGPPLCALYVGGALLGKRKTLGHFLEKAKIKRDIFAGMWYDR